MLLAALGDPGRVVFPRSAVKLIQALPLVESGAADHYRLTPQELALASGSHSGEPGHVALARGLLNRVGLDEVSLACGGHLPIGQDAQRELLSAGRAVTALHSNCSGKHAGMLATARFLDEPIADYELAQHSVQRRVRAVMQEVTETDLGQSIPGIDGCSVPNWPLPLDRLAIAFGRIVSGQGQSARRADAFGRLVEACWAAPEAMAGRGRYDTEVLRRFPGEVFIKGGAEGVYCGGIRSIGVGFALKIDDGAERAAEVAVGAVIASLLEQAGNQQACDLGEARVIHNAAGLAVGDIRPGAALMSVLTRMR
jgi:L-asparaginase II